MSIYKTFMNYYLALFFLVCLIGCKNDEESNSSLLITQVESQLNFGLKEIDILITDSLVSPRTVQNGKIKMVPSKDWTSGFYPGNLWMMYGLTRDIKWKNEALRFTEPLEHEKWNSTTHDMGFKMFCSFGQAIKYTDNESYKSILVQSAKTLASRFNPVVGCIRSWDHNTDKWEYPVIIDNMMNLELLLWAAKETGNESFRDIAIEHANTTIANHFRKDNSSYHVIDYDPSTGEVVNKHTHQGNAHESSWARGQAWGLYGFTMMYRETGKKQFLVQAEKIARYLIDQKRIKAGEIPFWDFDVPNKVEEPFDASAAAIIASALIELETLTDKNGVYLAIAEKLIETLSSPQFLAKTGTNNGFLLKHSTGNKPKKSEIDVPLVYADYYFLESLMRLNAIQK